MHSKSFRTPCTEDMVSATVSCLAAFEANTKGCGDLGMVGRPAYGMTPLVVVSIGEVKLNHSYPEA